MTIQATVNCIIDHATENHKDLDLYKLQLILYALYGTYLAEYKEKLFEDNIVASWSYPEVWAVKTRYAYMAIRGKDYFCTINRETMKSKVISITANKTKKYALIKKTLHHYFTFSKRDLELLLIDSADSAYKKAKYYQQVLNDEDIYMQFSKIKQEELYEIHGK